MNIPDAVDDGRQLADLPAGVGAGHARHSDNTPHLGPAPDIKEAEEGSRKATVVIRETNLKTIPTSN